MIKIKLNQAAKYILSGLIKDEIAEQGVKYVVSYEWDNHNKLILTIRPKELKPRHKGVIYLEDYKK